METEMIYSNTGFRVYRNILTNTEEDDLRKLIIRFTGSEDLIDKSSSRLKSGYTSVRFDLNHNIEEFRTFIDIFIDRILSNYTIANLDCREIMIHLLKKDEDQGIDWHIDRNLSVDPLKMVATIVYYPFKSSGDNSCLLVGSRNRPISIKIEKGTIVLISPDVPHAVSSGRRHQERISLVFRYFTND